jgi:hypothetical protein
VNPGASTHVKPALYSVIALATQATQRHEALCYVGQEMREKDSCNPCILEVDLPAPMIIVWELIVSLSYRSDIADSGLCVGIRSDRRSDDWTRHLLSLDEIPESMVCCGTIANLNYSNLLHTTQSSKNQHTILYIGIYTST